MRASGLFIRFGSMIIVLAMLASCAASKRQDGFSYKPKYAGPDIQVGGGGLEVEEKIEVGDGRLKVEDEGALQELIVTGITVQSEQTASPEFKTSVREMAKQYGEKRQIIYSKKQLKKLDRIAIKLEKQHQKKQGPDVTWGPSNNLEWAILGAAAVGLFVGIFGIGFGWAIFLLAALAYLYFKLLHNN
ncbi:MAG: hypothetical protein EAZ17_03120 [Sphingobacteriales bacterium]|nr:MAG: hypothetical protein EAZ17_03120 [Sphingobacteriales bacterium]